MHPYPNTSFNGLVSAIGKLKVPDKTTVKPGPIGGVHKVCELMPGMNITIQKLIDGAWGLDIAFYKDRPDKKG